MTYEYEVCFKCHADYTPDFPYIQRVVSNTNTRLAFDSTNPSYHPVLDPGQNLNIPSIPSEFEPSMSPSVIIYCTTCHSDDERGSRGPHGSSYRYILRRPYQASSQSRLMTSDEICFSCHTYDVYGNPSASDAVRAYSRFNKPGVYKGHAEHVGEKSVPCYACHVTDGAPARGHLIVTGRGSRDHRLHRDADRWELPADMPHREVLHGQLWR